MPARILQYSDVENAYDDPARIGRLAGVIADRRDRDTLLVGTGDNTAPGVLSLVSDGKHALEFFNAVQPDVSTFGNHDFDYGTTATEELVAVSPQQWVTANVFKNGERFGGTVGVTASTIRDAGSFTIGFVGVTDASTPAINPRATDLEFTDPIDAVATETDALRDTGVDAVVVLSHLGRGDDELARRTDVDVVLGGHVHEIRNDVVDETVVTRPGVNGEALIEITFDDGPVATVHDVSTGRVDKDVADALRERMAATGLNETVATVRDPISRKPAVVHGGECRAGNLIADAYRYVTDADIGLQNSGGIRPGDPLTGDVTVADLVSLVPFEEPVSVAELTGRALRRVLACANGDAVEFGHPEWWHAHVSGATIFWDDDSDVLRDVYVAGRPVQDESTYRLATSAYLFETGHEFPALTRNDLVETHDIQYEALVRYARDVGLDVTREDRIVRERTVATNGGDS